MKKQNDEIEKTLSEMPKINDSRSFDDYYNQISKQVNQRKIRKHAKRGWIIPAITSAAALVLVFIIGLQFINTNQTADEMKTYQSIEDSVDQAETNESANESASSGDAEMAEIEEYNQDGQGNQDMGGASNDDENQQFSMQEVDANSSMVVTQDESQGKQFVTFIIPDNQVQYFAPITVEMNDQDPYEFFNQSRELIMDDEWGLSSDVLSSITFIGMNDQNIPILEMDETELQDGTAIERVAMEVIRYFQYLGHEKVAVRDPNGDPVSLAHVGEVEEVTFENQLKAYKLYQPQSDELFWIEKVLMNGASIEEAIEELKVSEEAFNIKAPVPNNVNIEIEGQDPVLNIRFLNPEQLAESTEIPYIIESILLTAKSFGYEQVDFNNLGMTQVGPYQLDEPVQVPAYINPR
ncbi:hypothetical protein [Tenuibacillus multivorans]|uniref:Sporulation and spore germination n=1 Tax=Tenuibacillus multivorans TaxID=237069 RepID=A0A1H0CXI3_9BACI|nr:hypothetical protein [Tenuibacillus multivorans]GEL76126.1 hypothetical protein TMU01_03610 [Tenuibacillus multivorans]SDN62607.1 hypothetical protein SAMN05216498_2710 [Tenuibacillus multivorans]